MDTYEILDISNNNENEISVENIASVCMSNSTPLKSVYHYNEKNIGREVRRTLGDGQEDYIDYSSGLPKVENSESEQDDNLIDNNDIIYIVEKEENTNSVSSISDNSGKTVITDLFNNRENISDQLVSNNCSNNNLKSNKESSKLNEISEKAIQLEENEESDHSITLDKNNSLFSSEDENSKLKTKNYITPDILSLLKICNDDTPKRLKSLDQAALVMKNLLCEYLPGFTIKKAIPDSPECLLILLQECLSQYQETVNAFKSRTKELELELEENRRISSERYDLLVEEHKERLARVFKDHEQQLTAAVERAINSRKQAGSLQAQLALTQTKVKQLENQGKKITDSVVNEFKQKIHELFEEKEKLILKIEALENEIKFKNSELKTIKEMNLNLKVKNEKKSVQEKEYLKKLEKELATECALVNTLQNELQKEQHCNKELWIETDRKAQEIAVLQSKLETTQNEIDHKDNLLQTLREDILENFSIFYQETLNTSSSFSESTLLCKWISSVKEKILTKDSEIQEKGSLLATKELTLNNIIKELKEKECKIENVKEKCNVIQLKIDQLLDELKTKKELIKKYTIHLKKTEKKVALILNQTTEKNTILQSINKQASEIDQLLEEATKRILEGKQKEKDIKIAIGATVNHQKLLLNKFKTLKKQEEILKNQYLSKQSHIDYLQKLLESKQKLISNLEVHIRHNNDQLVNLIDEPANCKNESDNTSLKTIQNYSLMDQNYLDVGNKTDCSNDSFKEYRNDMLSFNKTLIESPNYNKSQNTKEIHKESEMKTNLTKHKIIFQNYIPLKSSSVDSGFITGSVDSSVPSLEHPSKLKTFNNSTNRECSLSGESQNVCVSAKSILANQSFRERNFTHSNSLNTTSPFTVSINLHSPILNHHLKDNNDSKQLCCNVAVDMKTIPSKSLEHIFSKNKNNSFCKRNESSNSCSFIEDRTESQEISSLKSDNFLNKFSSPRSSTPIHKINQHCNNASEFCFDQNSEQERMPIEGGEQT